MIRLDVVRIERQRNCRTLNNGLRLHTIIIRYRLTRTLTITRNLEDALLFRRTVRNSLMRAWRQASLTISMITPEALNVVLRVLRAEDGLRNGAGFSNFLEEVINDCLRVRNSIEVSSMDGLIDVLAINGNDFRGRILTRLLEDLRRRLLTNRYALFLVLILNGAAYDARIRIIINSTTRAIRIEADIELGRLDVTVDPINRNSVLYRYSTRILTNSNIVLRLRLTLLLSD